jgi:nucleotide-binding universal stress UspA family protein
VIAIDQILCAVDFSDHSRHALDYASAIGAYYGARVTALHVVSPTPLVAPVPFGLEGMQVGGNQVVDRQAMEAAARHFVAQGSAGATIDVRVSEGPKVADEVLVQADRLDADIVVVGSHGRSGFERLLLGSIADRILRKSRRPVLVVPPHAASRPGAPAMPFKRILCPIDFADGSLRAIEYAVQLAEETDGLLILLHAIELPPEFHELLPIEADVPQFRSLAETACRARLDALVPEEASGYCTIQTKVVEGKAHQRVLAVAGEIDADLIVMGVQGRGAVDVALFGSNTQAVVRGATCPVLTVRA